MSKIHAITAANGAIVHVELNHIDGDDAAAIAVAQACIDDNTHDFDEAGDVYQPIKLSRLVQEHYDSQCNNHLTDEVTDGASSAYSVDVGDYTALWTSGISTSVDLCICADGTTIENWVRGWEHDAREYCESFGFGWDDGSAEVDEDFEGDVAIQVTPYFYKGTLGNGTTPHLLRDDDGDVRTFDSAAAAQEWIDEQNEGVYVLRHGEYASPDYTILDASTITS